MITASDLKGDYAFLSFKAPAFDLTDRGVGGRPAASGLDAFVYAERGVYRSGETVHLTALLRDPQANAALGVPLTVVIERPDGVEFRRALVADQGLGGHGLTLPLPASAATGTWHARAFTDPKRPAVGETSFLVEDYVPDRIEFDLTSAAGHISQQTPAKVEVSGRFLYGAPAADLDLEGEVTIAPRRSAAALPAMSSAWRTKSSNRCSSRSPICRRLTRRARRVSPSVSRKLPSSTHPLEAQVTVRMGEPGGRAVEHNITLPVTPAGNMIGVKPQFSGRSLADAATRPSMS